MDKTQVWKRLADSHLASQRKTDDVGRNTARAHAAMSLLSDAQELADRKAHEASNDHINAAKVLLCDMIDSMPRL